ncbi:MAG: bifunctional diguanylate cyclase/phosphodiesterase [Eubacteriales bacterium]
MNHNHGAFISTDLLHHNFAAERAQYLHLLKAAFHYVFEVPDKSTEAVHKQRISILHELHSCNYQVDDTIFDNTANFIITILNIENYYVIITDSSNKQIIYANPSAKLFIYDPARKTAFCKQDCTLLNQLVNLDLSDSKEHHIDMKCEILQRNLSSDSFVFNWDGKESFLHFISDDTNHLIANTPTYTKNDQIRLLTNAYLDTLTNTYNKRYAYESLNHFIFNKDYFSVVILNVNNLAYINDNYGCEKGDEHLIAVTKLLRSIMRDTDILSRVGGDDFLMIFPTCTEIDATSKMRTLRNKIIELTTYGYFGVSYGVKELTPANTMETADIIDELYKKMNFYKQLQQAKYCNFNKPQSGLSLLDFPVSTESAPDNLSMDYNFDLPNFTQFEIDKDLYLYDKVSVIRVENADLTIAISGSESYYRASREILPLILKRLDKNIMNFYAFDYKTFLIGCTEGYSADKFLILMRKLCDQFGYATAHDSGLTGIVRFALVSETENLVEKGLSLLIEHQNDLGNFFVYDQTTQKISLTEESAVIQTVRNAIVNNQIVAYYQGIRNNTSGLIDTYEALMRIVDSEGIIYSPHHFLDIAKKYKLYDKLTYLMIDCVLNDFRDRTERVSINVVTSDIRSVHFRNWFYQRLDDFPDPKRLILEIVESEEYTQEAELAEFIDRLRSYGVMIAIDDFGSGYSNLGKIINLKPDIIKIDGSIIQHICDNKHSQQVLDVIVSMSKILDAYVVAEYIENEEIQSIIDEFKIACSQGFLYSKPTPIEELPPILPAEHVCFNHLI